MNKQIKMNLIIKKISNMDDVKNNYPTQSVCEVNLQVNTPVCSFLKPLLN